MTRSPREIVGLVGAATTAGASVALLLGLGTLLPPPPATPAEWAAWATEVGPAGATFALLRLLGLALGAYLGGCFALAALGSACSLPHLVRAADRLSFGVIRRTVAASTAGVVLSTSALGGLAGATLSDTESAPVMRVVDAPSRAAITATSEPVVMRLVGPAPASAPVVMRLAAPEAVAPEAILPGGTDADIAAASRAPGTEPRDITPGVQAPVDGRYVVQPGDHLWSIAERTIGSVDDGAVAGYWRLLVAANREVLVDPANPDLLFAGQQLRLPQPRA